jgi:hypothetical protein
MEITEIKRIPIPTLLRSFNINPVRINNREAWYYAFSRSERTPSVKVDLQKNLFYDFGSGEGGTIIDLAITLNSFRGASEAIAYLTEFAKGISGEQNFTPQSIQQTREEKLKIISEIPLCHPALLKYISKRKVCTIAAQKYCTYIQFEIGEKKLFAIGFKNDLGGYEIRNEFFKGSSSPKAVTTYLNGNEIILIFEGFFDFLSFASCCPNFENKFDVMVLNSVSNLKKIDASFWENYIVINCFFDNDDTGKNALKFLKKLAEKVIDFSVNYYPCNDLNEWLITRN